MKRVLLTLVGVIVVVLLGGIGLYQTTPVKVWIADLRWHWFVQPRLKQMGAMTGPQQIMDMLGPEMQDLIRRGDLVWIEDEVVMSHEAMQAFSDELFAYIVQHSEVPRASTLFGKVGLADEHLPPPEHKQQPRAYRVACYLMRGEVPWYDTLKARYQQIAATGTELISSPASW